MEVSVRNITPGGRFLTSCFFTYIFIDVGETVREERSPPRAGMGWQKEGLFLLPVLFYQILTVNLYMCK